MRELEDVIFREFFSMGFSARKFNALAHDEKLKVHNTLCYQIKSKLTGGGLIGSEKITRGFRKIEREVFGILFCD